MSKVRRKGEFGGFDNRICRAVSGFGSVSSLQTKTDILKTEDMGVGKRFEGFCRIIRNNNTCCYDCFGCEHARNPCCLRYNPKSRLYPVVFVLIISKEEERS